MKRLIEWVLSKIIPFSGYEHYETEEDTECDLDPYLVWQRMRGDK